MLKRKKLCYSGVVQIARNLVHIVQAAAALLGKYTRTRKNNAAQLKLIRFYHFKKYMKAMVFI
jgi:hypothetical protein